MSCFASVNVLHVWQVGGHVYTLTGESGVQLFERRYHLIIIVVSEREVSALHKYHDSMRGGNNKLVALDQTYLW